ncbi:hypothetical protein ACFTWF_38825 [Rhodococcus sp. NPDC056960]|uniref:hypothetical protein n=1 Tax=Rhodococcus sp. NPDC056960 TaxID=3345982 RepID=UPI003636A247
MQPTVQSAVRQKKTHPSRHPEPGRSRHPELAFPGVLLGATFVVGIFGALAIMLSAAASLMKGEFGQTYSELFVSAGENDILARISWALGDMTEPQSYASGITSIGLLCGATIAWLAWRARKRWAGMPTAYGTGLWPWVLGSSMLSLTLSNLLFGGMLDQGWQPTFVPFVSVPALLVLVYGRGWAVLVTGAVSGAVTTTPVAILLIQFVSSPLELPGVVAITASMSLSAAVTFTVSRYLPWMQLPAALTPDADHQQPLPTVVGAPGVVKDAFWTVRRVLVDFTEAQFCANEWASLGVILGVCVAFILNPLLPAFGTELLPQILFSQALASALGVVMWHRRYRGGGWAPTFIPVVSVAPASVIAFDGSALSIVVGAAGGALLGPVFAMPIMSRLPKDFHPFIGVTVSIAITSAIVVTAIRLLSGG